MDWNEIALQLKVAKEAHGFPNLKPIVDMALLALQATADEATVELAKLADEKVKADAKAAADAEAKAKAEEYKAAKPYTPPASADYERRPV